MSHHAQLALLPVLREWSLNPTVPGTYWRFSESGCTWTWMCLRMSVSHQGSWSLGSKEHRWLCARSHHPCHCSGWPSCRRRRGINGCGGNPHQSSLWASTCSLPSYTVQPLPFPNHEQHSVAEHKDSYLGAFMAMMQPLTHATSFRTMEI